MTDICEKMSKLQKASESNPDGGDEDEEGEKKEGKGEEETQGIDKRLMKKHKVINDYQCPFGGRSATSGLAGAAK